MTVPRLIIIGFCVVFLLAVSLEALALFHEKRSVGSFAQFWVNKNQTSTGTLTYVALGDSTAQGIGASKPENSYVGIVAARLARATGKRIRVINLSKTGARMSDVLSTQLPQLKAYAPDIVTVEIGANDVIRLSADAFSEQFAAVLNGLPDNTYISNMPYFGGRIRASAQIATANLAIQKASSQHAVTLVDLYSVTRQRQSFGNYAADLFHPSNRGYTNWADAFWAPIKNELKR